MLACQLAIGRFTCGTQLQLHAAEQKPTCCNDRLSCSYNNPPPVSEDFAKEPPVMPPHLQLTLLNLSPTIKAQAVLPRPQHVILNHLYCQKGQVRLIEARGQDPRGGEGRGWETGEKAAIPKEKETDTGSYLFTASSAFHA